MHLPVRVLGTGIYTPSRRVTASQLDADLHVEPGTTLARNGVCERFFAGPEETASSMSAAAIRAALEKADLKAEALDAVVFCGVMSEQPMPSTAILVHRALGARREGVTCFDINASCTGFLRGMEIAAAHIASGLWRHAVVVAAEIASKGLNWADLDTATLFGDGAAAAVFGPGTDGSAILDVRTHTLSEGAELCTMRAGGSRFNPRTPPARFEDYLFTMNGRALLRMVQAEFPAFLDSFFSLGDVAVVIPHQASAVGLAFLKKQLTRRGTRIVDILAHRGNQVSVSLPTALHHAIDGGDLRRGETALLVGTAAGVSFSGLLFRY